MLALGIAVLAFAALHGGQASGAVARAGGTKTVDIRNFAFHPPTLSVARGTRVAFVNSSGVAHTATRASFDTKRIAPGKTAFVRFAQQGSFAYHCTIHPFMRGKIVVH